MSWKLPQTRHAASAMTQRLRHVLSCHPGGDSELNRNLPIRSSVGVVQGDYGTALRRELSEHGAQPHHTLHCIKLAVECRQRGQLLLHASLIDINTARLSL